jgi:hypothetical protein
LDYAQIQNSIKSDSEKISSFIEWCKNRGLEEVIIRLSTEDKNWMHENYFLDFTTSRLIVSKKSFKRKILDTGFIAGMTPFPYLVLAKDKNIPDFRKNTNLNPQKIIGSDDSNFYVWYSDIEQLCMRRGIETTVSNMFGSAISANFLTIRKTDVKEYSFRLPVGKNGTFEKIYYWLEKTLPIKITAT